MVDMTISLNESNEINGLSTFNRNPIHLMNVLNGSAHL